MKKVVCLFIFTIGFNCVLAQNISCGILYGFNGYDVRIDNTSNGTAGYQGSNIGFLVDYQFKSNLGFRGNLIYNKVKADRYWNWTADFNEKVEDEYLFDESELKTLQLHALLRFDVSKTYNKGFYFIGGFNLNTILSAEFDGVSNNDFYNKVYLSGMLGFGVNFAKHFGIELIPELNLTNTMNSSGINNAGKNFGIHINLLLNNLNLSTAKK